MTRGTTVWSGDRTVTIVQPGWWPPGAGRLWGVNPYRAALGYGAAVALFGFLLMLAWPALRGARDAPILPVLAGMWALAGLGALVQLVRVLPDLAGRTEVAGRIIYQRLDEGYPGGEGPCEPDTCWIAVDDGHHDTAPVYRVSGRVFAHVRKGDLVRLTVGARHGYVFEAHADSPVGSIPAQPGAPLGTADVSAAVRRVVRAIDGPAIAGDVCTWTYHLGGGEPDASVRIHLSAGLAGVEQLIAMANRSDRPAERVSRVGEAAWRFNSLLVARHGELTIGIEPAPGTSLLTRYVDDLARLVLSATSRAER